jgi:hypothetical protein
MRPYFVTLAHLRAAYHPSAWWTKARLLPCINTWPDINPFHEDAPALIPPGFLIFWPCADSHTPGILNPWPALLASTTALGAALRAHHGGGLVLDCEDYRASHGGGKMKPGTWAPGTAAKGTALAKARGSGLSLGAMVWAGEVAAQPGLRNFWRAAFKQNGRGQVLGEDYAGSGGVAAAQSLGGHYLHGAMIEKAGQKKPDAGWIYDPSGLWLKG